MKLKKIKQKKSPHHRRSRAFKKAISLFGISLALLSGVYILAGLMLNPRFFLADAKEKAGIVKGVMISMRVVGEPGKPTVTTEAGCDSLSPKVTLTWDETIDTTSYDIERDGSPLVTGLSGTSYEDTTADTQTAYSYVVIAQGPRGSTAADPAVIETLGCTNTIPATVSIVTIGGKNVVGVDGTISISDSTPTITGTTNIPNAQIRIEITLVDPVIATLNANNNGYWSWTVPFSFSKELHLATITATDPLYDWRTAMDTKYFKIISKEEEKEEKKKESPEAAASPVAENPPAEMPLPKGSGQPLELNLEVLNIGRAAYVGGDLNLKSVILPKEISIPHELDLLYRVYASNKEDVLFQQKESVVLKNRDPDVFFHDLKLPVLLRPGRYIISVQTTANGFFINAQSNFEVLEVPLFSVGSLHVTWSMLMESVSWAILGLLLFLIIFLGLLELEHHRASKALFQITENFLMKKGYFSRRKGVSQ